MVTYPSQWEGNQCLCGLKIHYSNDRIANPDERKTLIYALNNMLGTSRPAGAVFLFIFCLDTKETKNQGCIRMTKNIFCRRRKQRTRRCAPQTPLLV